MLKNLTTVIDIQDNSDWRIDQRTRGRDIDNGPGTKPSQTWILVLSNKKGERRFVPEARFNEFFRLPETEAPAPKE